MERYFIIDKYNSWIDWHSILEDKGIGEAEPKINLVELDGRDGSLDLSEALTGEVTYKDRVVSPKFWTDYGTYKDREKLLQDITRTLHGKKVKIIEPDDPDHYFYGRIIVKSKSNNLAYATFTLEATCDPWRYAINETERVVDLDFNVSLDVVLNNYGAKTVCPEIIVDYKGHSVEEISFTYNGVTIPLTAGTYKISDLKLRPGATVVNVSNGYGIITFKYREADL